MPGDALLRYTVPMPDDSLIPGGVAEKVALNGSVLSTVKNGGLDWTRTNDLGLINTALAIPRFSYSLDSPTLRLVQPHRGIGTAT